MSLKNTYTTSDYIAWDTMLNLVHRLFNDGDVRMSLLISCGAFFGLRISDLLVLRWNQFLNNGTFLVVEKKRRENEDR